MNNNEKINGKSVAAAERAKNPRASVRNAATIKAYNAGSDTLIAAYSGQSLAKAVAAAVAAGVKSCPKLYPFCASTPIRDNDGQRVLIEGRFSIGAIVDGNKTTAARFFAKYGYKVSSLGGKTRAAAEKRIAEIEAAFKTASKK